jgi:hypothetical protein
MVEATGKAAAYPWRGCRGRAGHRPRQPVDGERGNPSRIARPADRPGRWWAGSSSAKGLGRGRSPRSSQGSGKPATRRRGAASSQWWDWHVRRSLVNTGAPQPTPFPLMEEAEARVLGIQTKLHHWAAKEHGRRFDDLFNLVCDPAFLLVGWRRVRGNKGARSAGVDGQTAYYVERERGEDLFLAELRADLKAHRFVPLPVRERMIPKPGGNKRRLGMPTVPAWGRLVPSEPGFGLGSRHPPVPPAGRAAPPGHP